MSSPGPGSLPTPQVVFVEEGNVMPLSRAGLALAAQGGSVVCDYSFVDTEAFMMGVEVSFPEHYLDPAGKRRIFDHIVFDGIVPSNFDGSQPYNFDVCIWPGSGSMSTTVYYRLDEDEDDDEFKVLAMAIPTLGGIAAGSGIYKRGNSCTISVAVLKGWKFLYWESDAGEVIKNKTHTFTVTRNTLWVAWLEERKETKLIVHRGPGQGDEGSIVYDAATGQILRDEHLS